MRNAPERSKDELAALILRRVWLDQGRFTAPMLARELGENERRVQRILQGIERGGWDVERDLDHTLTIRPSIPIPSEG